MKLNNRDVYMFAGGVVLGIVTGATIIINKAITSDTFGDAISKALAEKVVNSVVGKSDRVSYNRSNRVSYRDYYYRTDRSNYNFDTEILFPSRDEANDALENLKHMFNTYGQVTVADLYEVAELDPEFKSDLYGWVLSDHINNAPVVKVKDGYMISLPKPTPLK